MIAKQYYYLVAGLTEYSMELDTKGFDALEIREQISEALSDSDRELVKLLYTYYDIENIINLKAGRERFNSLGNFSREQLESEMQQSEELPVYLSNVLAAYKDPEANDFEDVDTTLALEKSLYGAYYEHCLNSRNKFIRDYSEFDLNLRNVSAAITARATGMDVSKVVVGDNFVAQNLKKSTASDFALKGEVEYLDTVLSAITTQSNLVAKEKQIDDLRWSYAQDMVTFDYFTVNYVLCYLLKINTIQRWKDLDAQTGGKVFAELMDRLVDKDLAKQA